LDSVAKTALSSFFWSWLRNAGNKVGNGYPADITYDVAGNVTAKGPGDARVTAELLIAMRKYCLMSPNGDRASYQSQEYARAHAMADFANANLSSWTVDRSYAVGAFRAFANWATAVGDSATSSYYSSRANTIAGWLVSAQDPGSWHNYFAYLNGGGTGVYNGGIDQTGFSPYEFNARPLNEQFAKDLTDWWETGQAYNGAYLTVQSGAYVGGVHQWTPQTGTNYQVYPGSALQLADVCWKVANSTGNYHGNYARAWANYNFAKTGSGCRVTDWNADPGFIGGFVDWVNTSTGARPATWQRFVDTSAYFVIATEELVFSNMVDFSY
jgi:hypothetical protein